MIRRLFCAILFIMCGLGIAHGQSQYEKTDAAAKNIPDRYTYSVDSLATYINKNFPGERDKIRAIYIWITNNLKYNVYITFVPRDEAHNENAEIENTLKTREGVCRHFAMLFCALAERVGVPAFSVVGYNKANGALLPDPHEWCIAKVNAKWYLYDPTFDMGYISNYQFIASPRTKHFQLSPQEFLNTHMPYDPMWQLMLRPYSYEEFDSGIRDEKRKVPAFQYIDSIAVYARQSSVNRLKSGYARVLQNGKPNRLVDYYLAITKSNIEISQKAETYNNYKEALRLQNQAISLINQFLEYRKAEFKPKKKEAEVRRMIHEPESFVLQADSVLNLLNDAPAPQYGDAVSSLKASIVKTATTILNQKKFVERYYATRSSERSSLFHQK